MKESAQEVSVRHPPGQCLTDIQRWMGRILAVHTTRGKSLGNNPALCDKRTFLSRSSRLDAAEWSLFLAVSPVTCRLHSKGPRVLNLHCNGASSLGWTTYTTIVSALAAASDHGFSYCLEDAAWLPMVPASACVPLGMMGLNLL